MCLSAPPASKVHLHQPVNVHLVNILDLEVPLTAGSVAVILQGEQLCMRNKQSLHSSSKQAQGKICCLFNRELEESHRRGLNLLLAARLCSMSFVAAYSYQSMH